MIPRSRTLAVLGALALCLGFAQPGAAVATSGPSVDVTVNANEGLGTIPATGYGLNSAVWDSQMNVPAVQSLLGQAGIGMLRYPGGSYGDIYHWQDNTATGGFVAPGTNFDAFMGTVKTIGAQPILIANYGTGTPQEAAAWVQYANVTKGYGAKYWEIGNENYGNGYYGANWEADNHASKSPTTYANNVLQYASAMKAVDPTVKIGAVLTLPGNWPASVLAAGDSADWNRTVLSIAGSAIDFVIVHWYPNSAGTTVPAQLTGELTQLRQEITKYAGAPLGIALTEVNAAVGEDTQPDALFGADTYLTALEQGVFTVDWWDTHNGATAISTAPDGATDFQDWGVLSSGGCVGSVCEPAMNTPFPTYHAISMLSKLGRPGDQMVRAGTTTSMVAAHAVRQANGDLAVMLVNKDPSNTYSVNLHYAGYTPSTATPTVYTYGDEASAITTAAVGSSAGQTLPPYSIETVVLTPSGNGASSLTAPGSPSVSQVTATGATVNWTPSTGGSVTRYEVVRQFGTTSELLAESTSTSATIANLNPGTGYTLNVLATDQFGNLSPSSAPVTVTTGTPASSTCAVDYRVTSGWGTGYVAAVTVTDTGPNPINGWTLTFAFPSSGETFSSGWNANWTSNGQSVQATSVSFDAALAANGGNSVSIGFVGGNVGAYSSPAAISLNGAVCTTTYTA
ncbi:MAG TPA: cellulose binding domain-containing protein [Pseudonocardiaceae bacterium]